MTVSVLYFEDVEYKLTPVRNGGSELSKSEPTIPSLAVASFLHHRR